MRLAFLVLIVAGAAGGERAAADETPYPLDSIPRIVTGKVVCPDVPTEVYRGTTIRFDHPARIYVGFKERLKGMEEVVRDTAIEVYGRAPVLLRHDGTYNCRVIRAYNTFLSEHAFGNAIDVDGFEFGPAPKGTNAPPGLRGAFSVSLEKHWAATKGVGALHSHFLRLLAQRIIERTDLFRVVLGPSYPGHEGHFHLDVSPWRVVDVFGNDPPPPG
jgi:hypothetical protein